MKKALWISSLFATLGCNASLAGSMGELCQPESVSVPCPQQMWDAGIRGLYLRPDTSAMMAYDTIYNNRPEHVNWQSLEGDWGWGFQLQASYHFNTGNDLTAQWLHFDNTSSQILPTYYVAPVNIALNYQFSNKLDQVNVMFGQKTLAGKKNTFRYAGGLQFVHIENYWLNSQRFWNATNSGVGHYNQTRKFNGVGPLAVAGFDYELYPHFNLNLVSQMALLYGHAEAEAWIFANNVQTSHSYSKMDHFSPSLEQLIGLSYVYPSSIGTFNLHAGYQWIYYFNSLLNFDRTIAPVFSTVTSNNQSYDGIEFGLHWTGNV